MINLFKLTDSRIYKKLGKHAYIRNGVGFGFISDNYLYDNSYLELGIGRSVSGLGDWGGGFDKASTSPLVIVLDKNFIIKKVRTDSFYNSKESKRLELIASKYSKRLQVGKKFIIKDVALKTTLTKIFGIMPCTNSISWDFFENPDSSFHNFIHAQGPLNTGYDLLGYTYNT